MPPIPSWEMVIRNSKGPGEAHSALLVGGGGRLIEGTRFHRYRCRHVGSGLTDPEIWVQSEEILK